jgi:hypothetical protein
LPLIVFALFLAMLSSLLIRCHRRRRSRIIDIKARSVLNGNNYPRVSYAELAKATDGFAEAKPPTAL